MTFFEQQHQARQQTRKLVFLFGLAVLAIVVAVNLAMALLWTFKFDPHHGIMRNYPKGFFETNTLITLLLIGGGTLIQTLNLRDGGDAVAQMAGGRLVSPASADMQERRLLSVVEEMALAAGIACPKVYLLEQEDAINAFAADYNPNEAVVAVTRGALNRLTRDELQGVVGHEFSHILNGDMRLNVHLIGVLFGIQMIAGFGQQLMNFGSSFWDVGARNNRDKGPPWQLVLIVSGLVLFVIGYIGIFFGRLIKSAVSRQREFLADASAVQFTRNPDGIGGALRKISGLTDRNKIGSQINHASAEQLSQLFLGSARRNLLDGWFATHPPLTERLRRRN
ncbi:M48 family metallopeptidase [Collimonas sp.]|jgi:Zn-dependent protease with chaperone function|uniref:M48 family metallopeptidase n=1 Tax=Collimonas sp. TaxID=1963772 RepID=UPI0037BFF22F